MKSIVAVMLAAIFIFGSNEIDVSARNIKRDRQLASEVYYEYEERNGGKCIEVDLNGDSVRECISLNPQTGHVYVYTCRNLKAKVMLDQKNFGDYGYVGYNAKKHLIVFKGDLGRYRTGMRIYKVGKKKCTDMGLMFKMNYGKTYYWINGKKVSKKTYNKKLKYYTRITKSVRKYGYRI